MKTEKDVKSNQSQLLYFVSSGGGGGEEHKYKEREVTQTDQSMNSKEENSHN